MSASGIERSSPLRASPARVVASHPSRATARALAVVRSDPLLCLLGIAGFLLRGGWIVFAFPIWTLPSPVALSTVIGADAYGASGLSARLVTAIVVALTGLGAFFLASLAGSAAIEVLAFERFVAQERRDDERDGDAAAEQTAATTPRELRGRERLRLVLEVMRVHAALLVPAGAALVLTVLAAGRAGFEEYLLPGDLNVPLALRVAGAAELPLALLVLSLFLADSLGGVTSRRVLAARRGLVPAVPGGPVDSRRGLRRALEQPLAALGTAGSCWLVTAAVLVPGLAVTLVAWGAVRSVFLSPPPVHDLARLLAMAFVTLAFVAAWAVVLALAGIAGAVRAALWTARAVPGPAVPTRAHRATPGDIPTL